MTPREKAYEIWQKMMNADLLVDSISAKQCALVAIDEILSMGIMSHSGDWEMAKSYWEEVKEEIQYL
jgi:hypothetical protein